MPISTRSRRALQLGCGSLALLGVGCGGSGPAASGNGTGAGAPLAEEPSLMDGDPITERLDLSPGAGTDVAGGQTSDFGDGLRVGCPVRDTEVVSVEAARARGFGVDAQLERMLGRFDVTWQRPFVSCEDTPARTGSLSLDVGLDQIFVESYVTAPDVICADELIYVLRVAVGSDDGLVSGSFQARTISDMDGLLSGGASDARDFAGSLGIRVDRTRPHASTLSISLAFTPSGLLGSLYALVSYDDELEPELDVGESVFWPPQAQLAPCTPRELLPEGNSKLISLDEYRSSN